MREIEGNGEIGIRSIDAKIIQTTSSQYDQDNRIMVNVILNYLLIALFLSNNHPEMYCMLCMYSMYTVYFRLVVQRR